MKILAIRLKNLASIEGAFEIDFTIEPLVSAGIFAISGATGSGKSTILDALCLALYDKTPRFSSKDNESFDVKDVGGNCIKQGDVRNILRRGTGEGYAEVVFLAVDGRRYASRWSVKRAYGRATGSLQQQSLQVKDEDTGEELQGRKTELLSRLVQLTGLTYEQFTRTVLLAQNEFATFLKSKEKAKAELLEKLTGTELYSRISEEIYKRSKSAEAERDELNIRKESVEILSPEQYEKYCEDKSGFETELNGINLQRKELKRKLDWYSIKSDLQKNLDAALEESAQVDEELSKAMPEFHRLEKIEEAEGARSVVATIEAVTNTIRLLNEAETTLRNKINICQQELKKNEGLYTEWEIKHAAFGKHKSDTEEKLKVARRLDGELELRKKEFAGSAEELEKKKVDRQKYKGMYTSVREKLLDKLQQIAASLNFVLPDNVGRRVYQEIVGQLGETSKQLNVRVNTLLGQNNSRQVQLDKYRINQLITEEEKLLSRKEEVAHAKRRFEQWQKIRSQLSVLLDVIKELQAEKDKTQKEKNSAMLMQKQSEAVLKTTRQLYESAKFAVSEGVTTIREILIEDEACPVCGSTSHPYLTGDRKVDHLYREIETQYNQALKEQQTADNRLNLSIAQLNNLEQQLAEKKKEQLALQEQEKAFSFSKEEEFTPVFYETALSAVTDGLLNLREKKYAYYELLKEWQDVDLEIKKLQEENLKLLNLHHQSVLLVEQVDSVKTQLELVEQVEQKQREALAKVEIKREETRRQLSKVLDGKSVVEVEQWLQLEEKKITGELEKIRKKIEEEQRLLSGTEGELRQLQTNKENEIYRLEVARNTLAEWLAVYNASCPEELDEGTLRELLAYPAEWIIHTKEIRSRLNDKRVAIRATLAERRVRLTQHEEFIGKPDPEKEPVELLESLLPELEQRYTATEKQRMELDVQLLRYEKNKQQIVEIEKAYQGSCLIAKKWAKLNDLFGSASGDKFKVIAQSYTLKILLLHANKHLEYLSTRYRLQQVPDTLVLQVIDRDMCDEVRTVYSLSGGESFLVSLALALGLSSLSGNNLRVESLFIDEGFGSLDADSLRIAMDALEQLRMQGRKIGVISHVQEMRERISTQVMLVKAVNGRSRVIIK